MTVDQIHGLPPGEDFDPMTDPALANQLGDLAMGMRKKEEEPVLIDSPPDGSVTLPGGLPTMLGVARDAVVRELTGEDEEELAKPSVARDLVKFMDTLLNRCVVSIGGEPVTREILDGMLVGDRLMLLQAIRVTTYGDVMRLDVRCPHNGCDAKFQVDYTFSTDVPIEKLQDKVVVIGDTKITLDAAEHTYKIPLKRGHIADVQLVTGWIQRSIYTAENNDLSLAELNTLLLNECVQMIDGHPIVMADVRHMSSADRLAILTFLTGAMFGPQWEEVKHSCPRCEREFPFVIDVETMFRGQ